MNPVSKIKCITSIPEINCNIVNNFFNTDIANIRTFDRGAAINTIDGTIHFMIAEKGDYSELESFFDCDFDMNAIKFKTTTKKYKYIATGSNSEDQDQAVVLVPVMADTMMLFIYVYSPKDLMKVVNSIKVTELSNKGSSTFEVSIIK